jgi:hypothetical protein
MQNSSPLKKLNHLSRSHGNLTRLYVNSKLSNIALDLILDPSPQLNHNFEAVKDVVQQILSANPELTLARLVDESLQPLQKNIPDDFLEEARCFIVCKFNKKNDSECHEECRAS